MPNNTHCRQMACIHDTDKHTRINHTCPLYDISSTNMTKKLHNIFDGPLQQNNFLLTLIALGIIFLIVVVSSLQHYYLTARTSDSLKIYDIHGQLIYDVRDHVRKTSYTSLDEVPSVLHDFLLRKEDKRFYEHHGIDIRALIRAAIATRNGNIQGASTIDQQAIKLSDQNFYERWVLTKLSEMSRARYSNYRYSKEEILLFYINNLHFPYGAVWFESACQLYFRKKCHDLSIEELIYLYARSKHPNKKNISEYAHTIATLYGVLHTNKETFATIADSIDLAVENNAPHFSKYVMDQHPGSISSQIHTSYDLQLHHRIQLVLEQFTPYLHDHDAYDACVIVLKGKSIASMNLLKPYSPDGSFINGCTKKRQVWSTMKPFLYALSFAKNKTDRQSRIIDEPVSFDSLYGVYEPKNFDLTYHGDVSLWQALASSLNVPAVKLLADIGVWEFYWFMAERAHDAQSNNAHQRNDDYQHFWLAFALGVKEMTPLAYTQMWSTFTLCHNPLFHHNPSRICERYGHEIDEVKAILSRNDYRTIGFDASNWLDVADSFGKTGTSRNFIDGWVCGGKYDYTVCVRVGNYDMTPMRASGHQTAGPIWHEIMKFIL